MSGSKLRNALFAMSPAELLEMHCAECPDRIFLSDEGGHAVTYAQSLEMVRSASATLRRVRATTGSSSAIVRTGRKLLDAIATLCCIETSTRFVTIDARRERGFVDYVATHSNSGLCISKSHGFAFPHQISHSEQLFDLVDSSACKVVVGELDETKETSNEKVGNIDNSAARNVAEIVPQALFYTSGSTGLPKGIVVSKQAMMDGAVSVSAYLGLSSGDKIVSCLPISFDYGFNQIMCALHVGCSLMLIDEFSPLTFGGICRDHIATVFPATPSILLGIGKRYARTGKWSDFESVRCVTNTGGRIPDAGHDFLRELRRRFETQPYLMYGLTEGFRSSYLPPELYDSKHNAIGRPVPGVSLMLIDDQGEVVTTPGVIGEIVHAGRFVSYGYYRDREATERLMVPLKGALFDGIFAPPLGIRSGDLGRFDADGVFFHLGRKDNLIKVREHRTSLDEVEIMVSSTNVADAVVVLPAEDRDGMQIVEIVVVPKPNVSRERGVLRTTIAGALPAHLHGFRLRVVEDLPASINGKFSNDGIGTNLNRPAASGA